MEHREIGSFERGEDTTSETAGRSDTKYGDMLADHEWSDPEPEEPPERTRVESHEIDVYYDTEPDPKDNYGRERYTVRVTYDRDTGEPSVLYAVEHRWKGNYWRDVTDWDWRDLPDPVRRCVSDALPVESPDDLDGGVRLMDEGGESRWEKHHKHRVESMSGDEMWGTSFLRDALRSAESASESFDDGSEGKEHAENIVEAIQQAITTVEDDDAEE